MGGLWGKPSLLKKINLLIGNKPEAKSIVLWKGRDEYEVLQAARCISPFRRPQVTDQSQPALFHLIYYRRRHPKLLQERRIKETHIHSCCFINLTDGIPSS